MSEALLVVDREYGVLHRKDCPRLLASSAQFEPYVGLEHAIESGRLSLCACVALVVMRATAEFIHQASIATGASGLQRLGGNLHRLGGLLEEGLQGERELHPTLEGQRH